MKKKSIKVSRADPVNNPDLPAIPDMEEMKHNLFKSLTSIVYEKGWNQAEASKIPGFSRAIAHHLFKGNASYFSAKTLLGLLLCSGCTVEVECGALPDGGILKDLRQTKTRKIDLQSHKTKPFSQEELDMMSAMYAAGESLSKIGKRFGISRDAVAGRLSTMDVKLRPAGRPIRVTPEIKVTIMAMRDRGRSWSEIGRDLDFCPRYLQVLYRQVMRVV